jgi:succinate dehydrogenase/fumarate reductase flavoprotein subunit
MPGKKTKGGLTRRNFLSGSAIGTGAMVLAGLVPKEADAARVPRKWDKEADVVIVGFGGAGAAAAIEATDAGSKVVILEKMAHAGGNTGVSGGFLTISEDLESGVKYVRAQTFDTVDDEELIKAYVENTMKIPDWFKSMGADMRRFPPPPGLPAAFFTKLPGAESVKDPWRIYPAGSGRLLFKFLFDQVMRRKVEVLYETPARRLIQDTATREILGVVATTQKGQISIKARKAVVLSCGGYENNSDMKLQFNLPGVPIYPVGTPGNTGDGIKMISEVGGQLWHTYCFEWYRFGIKPASDHFKIGILANLKFTSPFIIVNKEGKRFQNDAMNVTHTHETLAVTHFSHSIPGYPNIPFYAIFDETQRKAGPVAALEGDSTYAVVHKTYAWSPDNEAEINKGWIVKGETIRELAGKMDINPGGLEETVNKYNRYCEVGEDPDMGRSKRTLVALKDPPYYATELCLTMLNTMGGAKRNARAQVVDYDNKPIPRLYSAGEFGSISGMIYQGGQNLPEAFAFGRLAGKNGAAEKARKR